MNRKIEVLGIISNRQNRVSGRSGRADGERGDSRDARSPVRASVFGENTPRTVTDVERYRVSFETVGVLRRAVFLFEKKEGGFP